MAKYYNIGSTFDNIRVGLLDYYGAYDASTNPTGVDVKEYSSTLLIFTCTAFTDKVIKLTYPSSDFFAYFGDEYSGSSVITNTVPVSTSASYDSDTAIHMVCSDNTLLINSAPHGTFKSKLLIIGKLTNNAYAIVGLLGHSSSNYIPGCDGYLTADLTAINLAGFDTAIAIGAKRLTMPFIVNTALGALNDENGIVTFRNLYSVSNALGNNTCSKGIGYFMTSSGMYDANVRRIPNSMLMYVDN